MRQLAAFALAALVVRSPAGAAVARGKHRHHRAPRGATAPHAPPSAAVRGLVPSGPTVARYAPGPEGVAPAPDDLLRDRIVAEVRSVARRLRVAPPAEDARLDWAVTDLARTLRGDDLPSREAVDFLIAHYGLIEPSPHLFMSRGNEAAADQIVQHAHEQAEALLGAGPVGRMGVGVVRQGDEVSVVAGFQETPVQLLGAVARRLPHGRSASIAARVDRRYRAPQVVVTTPDGQVHEAAPAPGAEVGVDLRCGADGRYQIEIVGNGAAGPAVLANFPVFCGVAPVQTLSGVAAVPQGPADPVAAERELVELVNRDRVRAGLPALIVDPRLTAIARAHSQDMADHDFVGHVSPRTGTAMDRVRRTGLHPELVLENVGRAYGASEAESGFLSSPGHRGNLLDPHARRLGVGVVFGREVTGTRPMFVTQLMTS
ncbi:MAG TPA: CAP domain-containing protein [Polyangia bacterium]|nr:CAP domain-containing protein [Polyangia bacterium]